VRSRRTLILIVAVVVGAVAAFGIYSYVGSLEEQAYDRAERVEVWVVAEHIPKGTSAQVALAQQLIAKRMIPVDFRPVTYVADPATELTDLVAVVDLPLNSIVVQGSFVAPSVATTGLANRLEEEGLVTFTLSVDQVRGVAGMLTPGDDVNLMITRPMTLHDPAGAEAAGEVAVPSGAIRPGAGGVGVQMEGVPYANSARMLYQKVRVLAIGTQLAPDLGERDAAAVEQVSALGLVTLAVPPDAALRLASIDPTSLYLSLVPKSYEPMPLLPIDPTEILPGEDPARLTPYPPVTADAQ
jgi:Flp pilus assembly protein CpaB